MYLYDEIYFEISAWGEKNEIKKFARYLRSGAFDDFLEVSPDFVSYGDDFATAEDTAEVELYFSNDDLGIELAKLETDDFLDVLCKESATIDLKGHLYDINDDEYCFVCPRGSASYSDAMGGTKFNDELDEIADDEFGGDDEDDY